MSFRSIVRDVRDGIGSLSRRSFEVKLSSITGHLKGKSQGLPETHEQSPVIQCSRWASLPPELLRDVIKRLEASESTWPSRKHVVACAAVCRSWREMCLEIVRSPEFCGKLTFPISLKQPGHRDGMIQCFIKRDKSRSTFHLYLCLSPEPCTTIVEKSEFETLEALNHECKIEKKILKFIDAIHKGDEEHDKDFCTDSQIDQWAIILSAVLVENGKFLLSAKRVRKAACTEYLISMDAGHMSRSTNTCIGRLRSNFLGTKFVVYDTQPPCNGATISPPGRTSRRFYSKKVSPKVPSGSYSIAQVSYELNVLGTRGPRRMHCIMHSIPASALEPGGTVPGQPDSLVTRALEDSFRSMSFSKPSIMDRSMDFSSTRFSDIIGGSQEGELNGEIKERPLVLRNKPPRWHEQLQCWCLNFRGRVTVASVKNFQLIAATQPSAGAPTPSQPAPAEYDKIILQFGKVSKDMFTMDYRYPLSAFQAFAICLSSFDTKLACE